MQGSSESADGKRDRPQAAGGASLWRREALAPVRNTDSAKEHERRSTSVDPAYGSSPGDRLGHGRTARFRFGGITFFARQGNC
jgi:hypothetical protein